MRLVYFAAVLVSLLLLSCTSEPSLQKYFVEHAEKKNFIEMDVSSSILNLDKTKLTVDQKTALESFDKMNILAFRLDKTNENEYHVETKKVTQILKGKQYEELMKIGSGKDGGSISYVGKEDDIDEFVLFAKMKGNGFAVVRILGNDMNPSNIYTMLSLLKNSNIDMDQLKPLQGLVK